MNRFKKGDCFEYRGYELHKFMRGYHYYAEHVIKMRDVREHPNYEANKDEFERLRECGIKTQPDQFWSVEVL